MNIVSFVLASVGALLIYSGIKDRDPRDVVRTALGGKTTGAKLSKATGGGTVTTIPPAPTAPKTTGSGGGIPV